MGLRSSLLATQLVGQRGGLARFLAASMAAFDQNQTFVQAGGLPIVALFECGRASQACKGLGR